MRDINSIIIHCSATPPSLDIGADEIRTWHKAKGWNDIGYHFVIRRDGTLEPGRPVALAGAHARGHNKDSIGICYIGGIDEQGRADDNITEPQLDALGQLLITLGHTYPDVDEIKGHRDTGANKACPSFDVKHWLITKDVRP